MPKVCIGLDGLFSSSIGSHGHWRYWKGVYSLKPIIQFLLWYQESVNIKYWPRFQTHVPDFGPGVLLMWVRHFSFTLSLECSCNWSWLQHSLDRRCSHLFCTSCIICQLNNIDAPTFFCVFAQVACGFSIPFIQISSNGPCGAFAGFGIASECMTTTLINILNSRNRSKKSINWCCPVFGKSLYILHIINNWLITDI